MNKRRKLQILSLGATIMMICGVMGCNTDNKTNNNKEEVAVIEEVENQNAQVIYEPHYYNDTIDIDEAINSLGINRDENYPYDSYRFVRFVDNSSYERFTIVVGYVDYVTEEGKIIDTIYNYYDAFNGDFIFSTRDYRKVNTIESNVIYHLMDYGKLLDLRECVISKGLDSAYAYSVMSDNIQNIFLSTYDVARMYVLLVNSSNRLEKNTQMIIG